MSVETGTTQRHDPVRVTPRPGTTPMTDASRPPLDDIAQPNRNGQANGTRNGTSNGNGATKLNGRANGARNASAHPTPAPVRPRRYQVESRWASLAKRTVDLVVAVPLAIVMVVAFPWVALAIKLTSRGPVLFRQVRIGRGGQPIVVYKFRSMHIDAEARLRRDEALYAQYVANGFKVPAESDPRITPIGRFLRTSSIDELPQALCLLKGSMSVVGPRPVVPDELRELYGDEPGPYLACKPGLTGLWQTSGRSTVVHGQRARLDAQYALDWSLLTDIRILIRTVPAVLSAHGAH